MHSSLVQYEFQDLPQAMRNYLSHYGWHFNEQSVKYACSLMRDRNGNPLKPYDKPALKQMFERFGVKVDDKQMYDALYIANMCKADFFGSSITDEAHLALFVADYLNDKDGYEGQAFTRWYADQMQSGEPIYWEDML